jgi:hypothetical protein
LGAGTLGLHVEAHSISLDEFFEHGEAMALVNWNNQHRTALVGRSWQGPWIHINSIFDGTELYHGRVETKERADISRIIAAIDSRCDGCSLHKVIRVERGGHHFLEAAGMQAMLPREDDMSPDFPDGGADVPPVVERVDVAAVREISLVSVNVDGLGDYTRSATERMARILEEVLQRQPHFLLLQEVTMPMYAEIKRMLPEWQVFVTCRQMHLLRLPHVAQRQAHPYSEERRLVCRKRSCRIWTSQCRSR